MTAREALFEEDSEVGPMSPTLESGVEMTRYDFGTRRKGVMLLPRSLEHLLPESS